MKPETKVFSCAAARWHMQSGEDALWARKRFAPPVRTRLGILLSVLAIMMVGSISYAQIAQISAGNEHTCAVTESGGAKCWGANYTGELGNGAYSLRSLTPTDVVGLTSSVRSIAAGSGHACALTTEDGVKCWGNNAWGQLGNSSLIESSNRPVDVVGLASGVESISANDYFTCAVLRSGGVKCWGNNRSGQLGDASAVYASRVPVDVKGLSMPVVAVALGGDHACALSSAGGVKCWGYNAAGQIGGGLHYSLAPVDVAGATSGVAGIAAGREHTCLVTTSGAVKCWGSNHAGQLGDGTENNLSRSPVAVTGLGSGVVAIAAGGKHSCAVSSLGGVTCWGTIYQVDESAVRVPAAVANLSTGVQSISAGYEHNCVLMNGGSAKCWGFNSYGVVGDNTENNLRKVPVAVVGLASSVNPAPNAIMVQYRYMPLDYYFMTSRDSDKVILDWATDWRRTGPSFYVLTNREIGSSPITRFYFDQVAKNQSRGSHFYTLSPSEVAAVQALNPSNVPAPGKPVNEGVDSYAYLPSASGTCAPGLLPVYRLFRGNSRFPDDPNHRFTTDFADYNDFLARGWDGEGVKFCVPQ